MLNHVMIGASDIKKTKAFYDTVLAVLGAREAFVHTNDTGQTRLFWSHNGSTFSVSEPINGEPPSVANGMTIGFVCDSPEQLQLFHDTAIANGGSLCEEPPGPRDGSMGLMYLCYFRDPDGHKICGIHRPAK
ncbi:MAG: VOC family protein [Pseudomonadota bacterium]